MSNYPQDDAATVEELKERIGTLESHVKEIGNTLYDLIDRLSSIEPPHCPPICAREEEPQQKY
ncbi:MAG TPA: hypothetical protein VJ842_02745 [Pyrinomonadaceae bacterium]|nr:hypothetical protein [Pyrinomonadaceae bacterium]